MSANEPIFKGEARLPWLLRQAGFLATQGASEEGINAFLQAENRARCDPPLEAADIQRVVFGTVDFERSERGLRSASFNRFQTDEHRRQQYALIDDEAITRLPSPGWTIKGVLPAKGRSLWYAPPGRGKTFTMLGIAPSIKTVKSVTATRSICLRRCCIQALDPTIGAAPSAAPPQLETASRRGSSIMSPKTRATARNSWRSQLSNPHAGSSVTSRCSPGRAGVETGNRSTPAAPPPGPAAPPTGRVVSRAERTGTRARTAASRCWSGRAHLDATVCPAASVARKTGNRSRRSRRRPRDCGRGVVEEETEEDKEEEEK